MALPLIAIPLLWLFAGFAAYRGYRDGVVRRRIVMLSGVREGGWALFNGIGLIVASVGVATVGTLVLWNLSRPHAP